MRNNKFFLAAIVGTVLFFILGWLVYGMLIMQYMGNHLSSAVRSSNFAVYKGPAEMGAISFMALFLGNLATGFLYASILTWSNVRTAAGGAKMAAAVGFLTSMSIDFVMYGTSNIYTLHSILADVVAWTIITAITGGVIGMILGKGKTTVVA